MSITRWIIRGLLVLIIVLLLFAGYRARQRQQPDYYWSRAQAALAAQDPNTAKIHLQSMVAKFADDPRSHRGLAAALLREDGVEETPEGYAARPQALNMLIEAGKRNPEDLELQRLLLAACLRSGRVTDAAAAAEQVAKAEPENIDAAFARAWRATDRGDHAAALKRLDELPESGRQQFRVLGLRAQVLQALNPKDAALREALDAIATQAGQLTSQELAELNDIEFAAVMRLLPSSVSMAEDLPTAHRRAGDAISVCERLTGDKPERAQAAQTMAAQISTVLTTQFSTLAADEEQTARRQQLAQRLEKVLRPGATTEKPDLVVAREAAQLAFNQGQYEAAVAILDKALAAHQADRQARPDEAQALHFLAARALMGLRRHREAREHLSVLVADKRTSGLGQLMLGAVAAIEGRQQDALGHLTHAERELGPTPLVQMSLAQVLMALGKWAEALPYLAALHDVLMIENPEVQAWLAQLQIDDAQIHLQEARALLALKRDADAETHLAALTGTALAPRAAELRGEMLAQRGQLPAADAALAAGLEKFPLDSGLLERRAAVLAQLGKHEEAQKLLAAAAEQSPDNVRLSLKLAQSHSQAGRHDEALKILTALESRLPDALAVVLVKANALVAAGRAEEAGALAQRLQGSAETSAAGSVVGALAALGANDPQRAAQTLQAAGAVTDDLRIRYLEGEVAAAAGDYRLAIAALGESVRVTALRGLAGPLLCYSVVKLAEREGPAAAEQALAPAVAASPDDLFVLMAQADVLTMQGQFADALKTLDRLEQVEKDSPLGPHLKAAVLSRMNSPAAALRECERALAKDPRFVPSLASAAQLAYATRNFAASIQHADAGLAAAPQAWQFGVIKSEAQWAAGQQTLAVATARQLVERQPQLVDAHRHLVNLLTRGKQYEPALAACRQARAKEQMKDDFGLAVQEIALLHLTGQGEAGEALARQVIGEPPDAAKAFTLAGAFAAVGDFAHGRSWGQASLQAAAERDRPAVHQFLGRLALAENLAKPDRKLLEEARQHYTTALEQAPSDLESGNNLAWLLAVDFNQPAEAVPIAERTIGRMPLERLPVTYIDTLAMVYRRAGELQKAVSMLEQVLAARPAEPVLKFHLGLALGQLGTRTFDAKQLLREALAGGISSQQAAEAEQELKRLADVEAASVNE